MFQKNVPGTTLEPSYFTPSQLRAERILGGHHTEYFPSCHPNANTPNPWSTALQMAVMAPTLATLEIIQENVREMPQMYTCDKDNTNMR